MVNEVFRRKLASGSFQQILRWIPIVLVWGIASLLLFTNLGESSLWQDEAQTALIARTILDHGVPLGTDGNNFFSQELGAEYGKDYIWKWHTWLQFYIVAPFIYFLGSTTLAARLPFAILGLAAIVFIYRVGYELWGSLRAGWFAAALLASSVPFLLLSRQCRYYSLCAFLSLLFLYGYSRILGQKKHGLSIFILAGLLLFHSFHIYWPPLIAVVIFHAAIFGRQVFKKVALASGIQLLLHLPWLVWFSGMSYNLGGFLELAPHTLTILSIQIARHIFSPFLLLLPLSMLLWKRLNKRADLTSNERAGIFSSVSLLVLAGASLPLLLSVASPHALFRYLAPLIPIGMLLASLILDRLPSPAGYLVFLAMISWSPIANLYGKGQKNDLATMIYELRHEFRGPIDGIVKHLNQNGRDEDVVAITYGDLPVKYYTRMRVVGGLTGEDPSAAKNADWLIVRKYRVSEYEENFYNYINANINLLNYGRIELRYPDTPFQNREDPDEHRWKTAENFPPVVLYRRARVSLRKPDAP